MEIYLVGGAIRDELLHLPVKEKDWVVVGATPEEMLALGFKEVGKDFPVFLHPETKEEYALARRERKVGAGYKGFTFDTSNEVTLEEDLKRRDLTINAIAKAENGKIIDPYGGVADLKHKILRHVSNAFVEDPVRLLRIARFAARFHALQFTICKETLSLLKEMVINKEINTLTPERVWKEWQKALQEDHPDVFFAVLAACGAAPILFPSFNTQGAGVTLLKEIAHKEKEELIRFAILLHDMDLLAIQVLLDKYRIPNEYRQLSILTARYCKEIKGRLTTDKIIQILQKTDAYRRPERFKQFINTIKLLSNEQSELLLTCFKRAYAINARDFASLYQGKKLGEFLASKRKSVIEECLQNAAR